MPGSGTPAAVLGTVLDFGVAGNLEFFAIYSYTFQQQSLTQIQLSLVVICALLSIVVGVVIWLVIRGIVRPIERVAAASETLASGNLDMRVTVNRKDELGVLQQSFNTMADALNQKIDELEEASVFQKRFVSDVSHELRTPVTTMRMASDLLEMKKTASTLHQAYGRTVGRPDQSIPRHARRSVGNLPLRCRLCGT